MLVLADTYYPGWLAIIDGAPVPIRRADGAIRAVDAAGGSKRWREYRWVSAWIGAVIGGVGVVEMLDLRWVLSRWAGRGRQ